MANINRFEDLKAWQMARELCKDIYNVKVTTDLKTDFSLWKQINSASGSVMDNLAEGFGRGGNKEFKQYLFISLGSLNETKSQLYRILDRRYINQMTFNKLSDKAESIGKMINGLIRYLQNSGFKGSKFKANEELIEYNVRTKN